STALPVTYFAVITYALRDIFEPRGLPVVLHAPKNNTIHVPSKALDNDEAKELRLAVIFQKVWKAYENRFGLGNQYVDLRPQAENKTGYYDPSYHYELEPRFRKQAIQVHLRPPILAK